MVQTQSEPMVVAEGPGRGWWILKAEWVVRGWLILKAEWVGRGWLNDGYSMVVFL